MLDERGEPSATCTFGDDLLDVEEEVDRAFEALRSP
jgi:hypothetical protein